jgi:hypothetical protein
MSKADECRAKADECFELARHAHVQHHRRAYENIGHQWLALAEQIELEEKKRRPRR